MKIWFKEWKKSRIVRDVTLEDATEDTRTHKVVRLLDEACHTLDLSRPIWLAPSIREFQQRAKTRFSKDAFIDSIDFDYLEIEVIEEDETPY